jgi:hypothetical protein
MAEIVLGIGTSHSPQLRIPPEKWGILEEKDRNDPRLNYGELLRKADPQIRKELGAEVFQRRYNACQKALSKLRDTFSKILPNAVIIIGDDQREQFWEDNMPMFSIYYGEQAEQRGRSAERERSWWNVSEAHPDETNRTSPCDSALALHLIEALTERGFDLATSNKLRSERGIGHAFTFVINRILPADSIPIVPLMVNAFFPPNQPLPGRCYALGRALAEAVKSWRADRRVAVVASGGLSHFIIDEEIDRMALAGLLEQDGENLSRLPLERLMVLGTGEILNWITAAGAMEHLSPKLLDYVPCYRTPAGTGCAMGFMRWS